ncbi:MAG: hypothetical protein Q8M54_03960 [Desulfobaccales bacterium]|nr:hypothetical protein [Desulfobaccales bacterium]
MPQPIKLTWNNKDFIFNPVSLRFETEIYNNIFKDKNNNTLSQTLKHKKYSKFNDVVFQRYSQYLLQPLGEYLFDLKNRNDPFYKEFLNNYGDLVYSNFYIDDPEYLNKRGLYIYNVGGKIQYIGRCRDSFNKRINQGYGRVDPKNCYIDGQSTNVRLNALITKNRDLVELYICILNDPILIKDAEVGLKLVLGRPPWNIQ